jgi:hypothetical protein
MSRFIQEIEHLEYLTEKKLRILRELKRSVALFDLFPEIKEKGGKISVSIYGNPNKPDELKLQVATEDNLLLRKSLVNVPAFLRDHHLKAVYDTQGIHGSKIRTFFMNVDKAERAKKKELENV